MTTEFKENKNPVIRFTGKQLENSTSYSGSDIRVFVYKDLSGIVNGWSGMENPNGETSILRTVDNATKISDYAKFRAQERFDKDGNRRDLTGVEQRGTMERGTERYKGTKPTNAVDFEYVENGRSLQYSNQTGSSDALSQFVGLNSMIREIGSLKGINYSSFREKMAVRTLGRVHAKSYTRGQRTIAGTLAFTVLQTHELLNFANATTTRADGYTMLDHIPLFNLLLIFENEYGSMSSMHIFNVDVNTESQDMSIESLETNNIMNFYATDILPMEEFGNAFDSTADMLGAVFSSSNTKGKAADGIGADVKKEKVDKHFSDERVSSRLKRSRGLF